MTGNTIVPQVLGASTVAGISAAALPVAGGNPIFSSLLIGLIVISTIVVITRLVKIFAKK